MKYKFHAHATIDTNDTNAFWGDSNDVSGDGERVMAMAIVNALWWY